MPNQTRLLELALKGLEVERNRVDEEVADILKQLRLDGTAPATSVAQPARQRRRGRLTAEGRKKISEMMTARWAARRKGTQATSSTSTYSPVTPRRGLD